MHWLLSDIPMFLADAKGLQIFWLDSGGILLQDLLPWQVKSIRVTAIHDNPSALTAEGKSSNLGALRTARARLLSL